MCIWLLAFLCWIKSTTPESWACCARKWAFGPEYLFVCTDCCMSVSERDCLGGVICLMRLLRCIIFRRREMLKSSCTLCTGANHNLTGGGACRNCTNLMVWARHSSVDKKSRERGQSVLLSPSPCTTRVEWGCTQNTFRDPASVQVGIMFVCVSHDWVAH